jgi:RNA polymerase sigma-70 factor (ECF subfamily)
MDSHFGQKRLNNELALIEQAKTDDQAFGILYDFYFSRIYYFILKRVGQKEIAEDIVSTIFLKVFTGLKKFQPKNEYSFSSWLYRIATNNLTDYYRHQGKQKIVNIENIIEPVDDRQDLETQVMNDVDKELVRKILNDLSPRVQEILQLKFYGELSNLEIAVVLKTTPGNAGVLIYRALKKFKLSYQKYVK